MTMRDDLIAARALIKQGWCKGRYSKTTAAGQTQYCVLGALHAATGNLDRLYKPTPARVRTAINWLVDHLGKQPGVGIDDWNDEPRRKKAEVLAAFDRAIADLPEPKRRRK